jgi:hypothetical protein
VPPAASSAAVTDRLVWLFGFDLRASADVAELERVLAEGRRHGITGAVLAAGLDALTRQDERHAAGLDRVVAACRRLQIELIPAAFSFGYGGPFLSHDRNLAEGVPVERAVFVAGDDGFARHVPDPAVSLPGGGFEDHDGRRFAGLLFHDAPGEVSFPDTRVRRSGRASIRLSGFKPPHGHGRVCAEVAVTPRRCYRVAIWAKSAGLSAEHGFNLVTLSADGDRERSLAPRSFHLPPDSDWRRFTYLFNSREHAKVRLYAGVWGGRSGTLWLDDWTIEEVGPINVLRRPGCPVRVETADGAALEEGRDYARFEDPGLHPWREDRDPVAIRLLPGGRIRAGDRLAVSWYHSLIVHDSQVGVCMAEPRVYEIAEREARALVDRLHPRRVLLNMDEVRFGGTCAACAGRDMARLLGEAVGRIAAILKRLDPAIEIWSWSDMFDPHHNARGDYYLVEGSFAGSWRHLPEGIGMAVWGREANPASFEHFARLGRPVLGACYYDAPDLRAVDGWLDQARRHHNVRGLMYTTWERNYRLLGAFGDRLGAAGGR